MTLELLHPRLARRDCNDCLEFEYNEKTGKREVWRGGPVKRIPQCPPPCRTKKGCFKGTPENPNTLNQRNVMAYRHYLECKAVGQFPDDPIVKQNARIIREVEDVVAEKQRRDEREVLEQIVMMAARLR